jgi:uncharacterized protein DUF664
MQLPRFGTQRSPRVAAVAGLEEIARHAGHADIVSELIDGRTGF